MPSGTCWPPIAAGVSCRPSSPTVRRCGTTTTPGGRQGCGSGSRKRRARLRRDAHQTTQIPRTAKRQRTSAARLLKQIGTTDTSCAARIGAARRQQREVVMKRLLAIGVVGCLTAGLLSSAAGCAVHHYHHFVEGGGDPVIAAGPIPGILVPVPGPTRPQNQPTRLESVSSPRPTNPHGLDPVAYRSPGKDDEPKLPAPQKDKAKDASQPLAAPRRLMPDGPSATAEPAGLTLDQVINTTLLADPKIGAGLEAINQANADALTASLKPNPELFTDVQLLPLPRPFTVDAQGGPPQQDVIVSYPIDWFLFGKRAAAM